MRMSSSRAQEPQLQPASSNVGESTTFYRQSRSLDVDDRTSSESFHRYSTSRQDGGLDRSGSGSSSGVGPASRLEELLVGLRQQREPIENRIRAAQEQLDAKAAAADTGDDGRRRRRRKTDDFDEQMSQLRRKILTDTLHNLQHQLRSQSARLQAARRSVLHVTTKHPPIQRRCFSDDDMV